MINANPENLAVFWTSLCTRRMRFEGILAPLSSFSVTSYTEGSELRFRLDEATCARWTALENLLWLVFNAINKHSWVLWGELIVGFMPWPRNYDYHGSWATEVIARNHLQTVQAVFVVKLAQLSYMHYTCEKANNNEPKWLTSAKSFGIDTQQLNDFLSSPICTNLIHGSEVERAGMVIKAGQRIHATWWANIERLIQAFSLPVWLYYGQDTSATSEPHQWYAKYRPSDAELEQLHALQPENGVKKFIRSTPAWGFWLTSAADINAAAPRGQPDKSTRQYPDQTHTEFFEAADKRIAQAYANASAEQIARWDARRAKNASLEMPVKTGSTTVFRWNHNPDPSKNTLVRTLVGKKYWRETFEQFTKSQRRYDPVQDEFNLCAGLDTESYVEPDDDDYRDFNTDDVQPAHYPDVPEPELIAARGRSLSRGDPGPSSPLSSRR